MLRKIGCVWSQSIPASAAINNVALCGRCHLRWQILILAPVGSARVRVICYNRRLTHT